MSVNLIQNPDGSMGVKNELDGLEVVRWGGVPTSGLAASTVGGTNYRGAKWLHGKLGVGNGTGNTVNIANPEGVTVIVTRFAVFATAISTVTTTVDIGIAATAGATSDTLLDGVTIGATAFATGVFDNISAPGTNGKASRVWPGNQFIVGKASDTATSFTGEFFVEYIPA